MAAVSPKIVARSGSDRCVPACKPRPIRIAIRGKNWSSRGHHVREPRSIDVPSPSRAARLPTRRAASTVSERGQLIRGRLGGGPPAGKGGCRLKWLIERLLRVRPAAARFCQVKLRSAEHAGGPRPRPATRVERYRGSSGYWHGFRSGCGNRSRGVGQCLGDGNEAPLACEGRAGHQRHVALLAIAEKCIVARSGDHAAVDDRPSRIRPTPGISSKRPSAVAPTGGT